jgi:hypothetical protein
MKVRHIGTGSVQLDGVGVVEHGAVAEVPDAVGRALVTEQPSEWEDAAPARAARGSKGGGD